MILGSIKKEYQRYKDLAERAMAQVPDDKFHSLLADDHPEDNSIAIIVQHVSGNLRSRFSDFSTSDGEKPWRKRDREFEDQGLDTEMLMVHWQEAWTILFEVLDNLQEEDLGKTIYIRGRPQSIMAALHRSLSHVSYHVGQIVFLARIYAAEAWTPLTIPRGQSEAYNQNPLKG